MPKGPSLYNVTPFQHLKVQYARLLALPRHNVGAHKGSRSFQPFGHILSLAVRGARFVVPTLSILASLPFGAPRRGGHILRKLKGYNKAAQRGPKGWCFAQYIKGGAYIAKSSLPSKARQRALPQRGKSNVSLCWRKAPFGFFVVVSAKPILALLPEGARKQRGPLWPQYMPKGPYGAILAALSIGFANRSLLRSPSGRKRKARSAAYKVLCTNLRFGFASHNVGEAKEERLLALWAYIALLCPSRRLLASPIYARSAYCTFRCWRTTWESEGVVSWLCQETRIPLPLWGPFGHI